VAEAKEEEEKTKEEEEGNTQKNAVNPIADENIGAGLDIEALRVELRLLANERNILQLEVENKSKEIEEFKFGKELLQLEINCLNEELSLLNNNGEV